MSGAAILFVGGIKPVISMGVACPPRKFATEPCQIEITILVSGSREKGQGGVVDEQVKVLPLRRTKVLTYSVCCLRRPVVDNCMDLPANIEAWTC